MFAKKTFTMCCPSRLSSPASSNPYTSYILEPIMPKRTIYTSFSRVLKDGLLGKDMVMGPKK